MISEADTAPNEPVSPEDCDHLFPNVSDSRSDTARGAEESSGVGGERAERESRRVRDLGWTEIQR